MTHAVLPLLPEQAEAFARGAAQFNAGEFWEAHETWEPLWLQAPEPVKTFLQGLIQVAAGLVHVQRVNAKGALSKLGAGLEKLERVRLHPEFHQWMDLDGFIAQSRDALAEVNRLGAENLHKFCPGKFPAITVRCLGN